MRESASAARPVLRALLGNLSHERHDRIFRRCRGGWPAYCPCIRTVPRRRASAPGPGARSYRRCAYPARRHGTGLRRHRRRRSMELEVRLRSLRSSTGLVSAQVRPGHARSGRNPDRAPRDAGQARRPPAIADTPLAGKPSASAVLHANRAWLCRQRRGRHHTPRPGAGTVGRHGTAGHLRRARWRLARAE